MDDTIEDERYSNRTRKKNTRQYEKQHKRDISNQRSKHQKNNINTTIEKGTLFISYLNGLSEKDHKILDKSLEVTCKEVRKNLLASKGTNKHKLLDMTKNTDIVTSLIDTKNIKGTKLLQGG